MEKIIDNNYYDLIINNISVPQYDSGDNITPMNFRHSLLHIPVTEFDPCILGSFPYHNFPTLYTPTSTISIETSGIGIVQRNPFLNLLGRGVIIGIVDTGIDYTHSAFLNNDMTTKIISIWDQTIESGTPPQGFSFGSEYNRDTINLALGTENPLSLVPTTDANGHGTSIASIVAGAADEKNGFSGVVPEAEMIVVKLKEAKSVTRQIMFAPEDTLCYQETDIMLGLRYLENYALNTVRPLIICIALGSSMDSHDGQSALSNYVNYLSKVPGIGLSVSAGNEGSSRRHYYNSTTTSPFYHDIELKIGENDKLFAMELWPYALERLSIEISSPNRESTQQIYPAFHSCEVFNFIFSPSILWVNNFIFEEETGDQMILVRFQDAIAGVWRIRVRNLENSPLSFHIWLPSGSLLSNDTFFINPNPDTTITSPGDGTSQMTVTAYNQFDESILPESSRGYTRSGLVTPDVASPGYQIPCALPHNQYGALTGTGASAAHAAGAMAMLMEWGITRGNYPFMSGYDANRLIIRGARRDESLVYPNHIWGYGKLDVYNLFAILTNLK